MGTIMGGLSLEVVELQKDSGGCFWYLAWPKEPSIEPSFDPDPNLFKPC